MDRRITSGGGLLQPPRGQTGYQFASQASMATWPQGRTWSASPPKIPPVGYNRDSE